MNKQFNLDSFARHYLIAMLWSSTDDTGNPLDDGREVSDLPRETIEQAIDDCAAFQRDNAALLTLAYEHYVDSGMAAHPDAGCPEACAGHDFWLTRCGHGVGFWDRGIPGDTGDKLTDAASKAGNIDPYIGDDGRVYFA